MKNTLVPSLCAALIAVAPAIAVSTADTTAKVGAPSIVRIVKAKNGFQLQRNGQPYFIKGAGGDGSKPMLRDIGANSFRTWGADNLEAQLDEAQRLGLTVTIGIWLGHKEHGFRYEDAAQVKAQFEMAQRVILRYKDHPALLMWSIGNEMEMGQEDNALVWQAVEQIAAFAKKTDANHPTMTVIAEIGGGKVASINKFCPSIDVIGINTYAGAPSIPERYQAAGGVKPYVLTEFGPPGQWESAKKEWGAAVELSSTQKADAYRNAWQKAVANQPLSLGGYAFTWGNKQEATATWFGLLLPDGSRTGAVDALSELWGKPSKNRAPLIQSLKLDSPKRVQPGSTVTATLQSSDPEKDALKIEWIVQHDPVQYGIGGAAEAVPQTFPEAIVRSDNTSITVKMPPIGGGYRIFAVARDGKGGASVANVPLFVEGDVKTLPQVAPQAKLPLSLDDEAAYKPTGFMGNAAAIQSTLTTVRPHSGPNSTQWQYTARDNWGGVVWQSPADDWGDKPGGWNLSGAKKLTFWARGEKGGEEVTFQFGLLGRDKKYFDSATGKLDKQKLTTEWQQFSIDLAGQDLSHIKTGFCWVVAGNGQPITFYLDDIRYE